MFIVWQMPTWHSLTSPENPFIEFTRADGAFLLRRLVVHLQPIATASRTAIRSPQHRTTRRNRKPVDCEAPTCKWISLRLQPNTERRNSFRTQAPEAKSKRLQNYAVKEKRHES